MKNKIFNTLRNMVMFISFVIFAFTGSAIDTGEAWIYISCVLSVCVLFLCAKSLEAEMLREEARRERLARRRAMRRKEENARIAA